MATIKSKQFALFIILYILLVIANFPGRAFILILCWMQLSILNEGLKLTWQEQKKYFFVFLSLLPLFFLWGASNAFVGIHSKNGQYFFLLMTLMLNFILCFWISLLAIFSYSFAPQSKFLLEIYKACSKGFRNNFKFVLSIVFILFGSTTLLLFLSEDDRMVIGLIFAHLVKINQKNRLYLDMN